MKRTSKTIFVTTKKKKRSKIRALFKKWAIAYIDAMTGLLYPDSDLDSTNTNSNELLIEISALRQENTNLKMTPPQVIEKEVPVEVEKAATGDLKEAARLMANSELNKEDLTEKEILELLQKSSEEEVRKKIGFWATPLPKSDDEPDINKTYITKNK